VRAGDGAFAERLVPSLEAVVGDHEDDVLGGRLRHLAEQLVDETVVIVDHTPIGLELGGGRALAAAYAGASGSWKRQ
jgi:hypothetical protein